MADYYINVVLDDEKLKKIEEAGLSGHVQETSGKKVVQVGMTAKDQKKLLKGFQNLTFDGNNACFLPQEAENQLFSIILNMKTVEVMKVAITKLYNPLKGREIFGRGTGGR